MYSAEAISGMLKTNFGVIQAQAEGLTHEDSLLQLPFRGNCFNWILGHLIISRDVMLKWLGEDSVWDESIATRYKRDGDPVTQDGDDIVRLDQMLADLSTQQERILTLLADIAQETLDAPSPTRPDASLGRMLHFQAWHESYHVGQFEVLRQLAGKNDKVI